MRKFADPLPVLPVKKPWFKEDGKTYYHLTMNQFKQRLHSDLPDTTVWGYDGMYPGPTVKVHTNEQVYVKWNNCLPDTHLLPVDQTVHGAYPDVPEVRTVTHIHGACVRPESDGYPEAWFTKNFDRTGPYFTRKMYHYENCQQASTLWYHDHALGITRLNVYAGLAGFYLISDENEKALHLPEGEFDIPLLIQDRSFNADGSLYYPSQTDPPVPGLETSIVAMFFGDTILVNGKVWPYLEVEPRRYRLRLLNGSNSRFYMLFLDSGQQMFQIATDSGLRAVPAALKQMTLAPAERAEVIVDFTNMNGREIVLKNAAPAPYPDGPKPDQDTAAVMQFRVKKRITRIDTSRIPEVMNHIPPLSFKDVTRVRKLTLNSVTDQFGRDLMLLDNRTWDDPVTENPVAGTTEIWTFINVTMHTHPIHLHLVDFQILDRQPFDVSRFTEKKELRFTGSPRHPDTEEEGWKDTVRADPGEVTRIKARFGPFSGLYVWHCHILEHEDYEMMRPFYVLSSQTFL
ncbi:multicopper oxidase family protein [Alteribacter lacisalsi]|uniref:multicopper oxidase family protein n=1 Tax=Alteribacter lacisalsi TaxID=2045244 RepID=UPI001F1CC88C|nr:multicopper oxidase [Alteribacter lacisalsi]